MEKMKVMLELDSNGKLTTTAEGKVLVNLIYKGLAMVHCDKLECGNCPFENGSCGCMLLETEKQFQKILKNS